MIFDTNHDVTPRLDQAKECGVTTIFRYLSPANPSGEKVVKPAEAHAMAAAGIRLGLVCEDWGDFAHAAINAQTGTRDGAWCRKYAVTVGAPAGAAIYFAVDADANAEEIRDLVLPYFGRIEEVLQAPSDLPLYRMGVYGSGAVCEAVQAEFPDVLTWLSCSLGWDDSRLFLARGTYTLFQKTPKRQFDIDTDPDLPNGQHVGVAADIGDFMPFQVAAAAASPAGAAASASGSGAAPSAGPAAAEQLPGDPLIAALQKDLAQLGYDTGGIDGLMGPQTQAALQAWQRTTKRVPAGVPDHQTLTAVRYAAEAA